MADHPAPTGDAGGPERRSPDPEQIRQYARIGVIALVVLLVLLFVIENSGTVRFSFVFFRARISLFVLLVLTFVLGAIVGVVGERLIRRRYFPSD